MGGSGYSYFSQSVFGGRLFCQRVPQYIISKNDMTVCLRPSDHQRFTVVRKHVRLAGVGPVLPDCSGRGHCTVHQAGHCSPMWWIVGCATFSCCAWFFIYVRCVRRHTMVAGTRYHPEFLVCGHHRLYCAAVVADCVSATVISHIRPAPASRTHRRMDARMDRAPPPIISRTTTTLSVLTRAA